MGLVSADRIVFLFLWIICGLHRYRYINTLCDPEARPWLFSGVSTKTLFRI